MTSGNSSSILCRIRAVQEGDALEEPLDVRVRGTCRPRSEARGDLGVDARELAAQLAKVGQLGVVVGEQLVDHGAAHSCETTKVLVVNWRTSRR